MANLVEATESHLKALRAGGIVGLFERVDAFPNFGGVFHRIDYFVGPKYSIKPVNAQALEEFRQLLHIEAESWHPRHFYKTTEGHLQAGVWDYREELPGIEVTKKISKIEIDDIVLLRQALEAGCEFEKEEPLKEETLYREVTIHPFPSIALAKLVAAHERGFLAGNIKPNQRIHNLLVGLSGAQVELMSQGRFPFPRLRYLEDGELSAFRALTPHQRTEITGVFCVRDRVLEMAEFFNSLSEYPLTR